jgi:hypothetical protein
VKGDANEMMRAGLAGWGACESRAPCGHAVKLEQRPCSPAKMWNDDPLTANGFADDEPSPPWPTTPHPSSPIPNLRRAGSPLPGKDALGGPAVVDRQPQIYGAPEAGLISPRENTGFNGAQYEKLGPYLNIRIVGLDRNRRDILIRFDAQVRACVGPLLASSP